MRRYIRHPVDIPIEVSRSAARNYVHGENVSLGGLAFRCTDPLDSGEIVQIRIPFLQPSFETKARVAWCTVCDDGYELGVEFLDTDDAFRARMAEQVCSIESYKKAVYEEQQRTLSTEEAALEWIAKYAAQFPGSAHDDMH